MNNFTVHQQHQLLHIAWPDLYQAAVMGTALWLSLWHEGKRLKVRSQAQTPYFVEGDGVKIVMPIADFRAPKHPKVIRLSGLQLGLAFEEHGDPFVKSDAYSGLCHAYRGDKISIPNFEAVVS